MTKTTQNCANFIGSLLVLHFFKSILLIFHILIAQWLNYRNMKDELNFSHNGGGVVYLLQSGAIHFNLTVCFHCISQNEYRSSPKYIYDNPLSLHSHHRSICHLQTGLYLVFYSIFIDVIFIFLRFRFELVLSISTDGQGKKTKFWPGTLSDTRF